jgi:hypothetical protein
VPLTRSDIRRIRTIFLSKKLVHVKTADVEGLTGASPALLASWLVDNQFAADESSPLLTMPRGAAMAFVLETLPLEWIERALARQARVIPPLRRLQPVTLLLPRYQVRALRLIARRQRRPLGAIVSHELYSLIAEYFQILAEHIPHFHKAILWPPHLSFLEQPRWLTSTRR